MKRALLIAACILPLPVGFPLAGEGGRALSARVWAEAAAQPTVGGATGSRGAAESSPAAGSTGVPASRGAVRITGGPFVPPYTTDGESVEVGTFRLDARPVTVEDFLAFVRTEPTWRRSRVPALFADRGYLNGWTDDLDPGLAGGDLRRAVTGVSWFAAGAYCSARGGRLPTTLEWEYAARASRTEKDAFRDPDFNRELLRLHQARPAPDAMPPVGRTFRNAWGVWDLHGLVWEWTGDFNNTMLTGAGRDDQGLDRGLFCAAGSVDASDRSDYAAFLRYAFRTGLEGTDSGPLLGFRCAYDIR